MKHILLILLGITTYISASAQQNIYNWRVGVHGGIGTYYGDLSTKRILDPQSEMLQFWKNKGKNLSYGLSVEGAFTNAWSFRIKGTRGVFMGNDRATKWNGDAYTTSGHYNRALNFRTTYWDVDGIFIYHFDNGKLLGEEAFFAPYIGAGVGFMNFKTKGDLFYGDAKRYHYWSDNTIRNLAENDPNAANAKMIEQDGVYETDLARWQTEGKKYDQNTLTLPLALGLKFRLTDRFNINLETLLHYTLTDYLDDVADYYPPVYNSETQAYISNPSGVTRKERGDNSRAYDVYGMFNMSLNYNFGYKKQAFQAPVFFLGNADIKRERVQPTVPAAHQPALTPVGIEEEIDLEIEDAIRPTTVVIENVNIVQPNGAVVGQPNKVIRDTIYEAGRVIQEKVIIRRDTIIQTIERDIYRDTVGYRDNYLPEIEQRPVLVELYDPKAKIDTVVVENPTTKTPDTIVYQGVVPIELVPVQPVFTPLMLDTLDVTRLDAVYIEENIGYKKDDLTREEEVLAEVQESNFELIALRNRINELKNEKDRNRADIEAVYQKIDELQDDLREVEAYNNRTVVSTNTKQQSTNEKIQRASNRLDRDMEAVRSEVIYLESDKTVDIEEYNRVRKENEERIAELEEEMRKMRKKVRRAKNKKVRPDYITNKSRSQDKKDKEQSTLISPPQQIVVEGGNPVKELEYQTRIRELERQLAASNNVPVFTSSNDEIRALRQQIAALKATQNKPAAVTQDPTTLEYIKKLESKLDEVSRSLAGQGKPATVTQDPTTLEYIKKLEGKLDEMNKSLAKTQSELNAMQNRPAPSPSTTYVTQPSRTIIRPATPSISPARSAINRLGNINVYFNKGQSSVKAEFANDLNRVLSLMQQYPEITANITGYADKSGNPDINFKISKKRSEAVANYLRQRGIASSRINMNHLGEAQASSKNDPYARRVEIVLSSY